MRLISIGGFWRCGVIGAAHLRMPLVLVLLTAFAPLSLCQTPNGSADEPIRVKTILLNVPVSVSGRDGRTITGLKKEDFSVFQDKQKLGIDFFAEVDEPVTVAVLIDTSE